MAHAPADKGTTHARARARTNATRTRTHVQIHVRKRSVIEVGFVAWWLC